MTHEKDESRLDRTLKGYQAIRMDDEGKKEIHERVMESVRQPEKRQQRRWDMRPVVSFMLAGFLLVIGGYFIATELIFSDDTEKSLTVDETETSVETGNGEVTPYTSLEKAVSAKLGTEVKIPFHADVPLRTAFIMHDGYLLKGEEEYLGDPVMAAFVYSTLEVDDEEGESEELRKLSKSTDLIYGEFLVNDKHMVGLNILNGETSHIDLINSNLIGEEKTIAGKTVYYSQRKNSIPDTFRISFRVNEDVYAFYFNAERVSESYAYAFVEKSLKQIEE
ncbi:hypothetical protein FZC76_13720 [Sutcliffiella horikoshii]|uniref:DUF4367 domain-containing protein n=1 Tax=Sutcliffiella horikoshii TaxID=79883 RepID=A0A5D4SZ86_9BACI|nr:hypothetical protein [Sutcliffiella horikoshii]TYS67628.1 hypothetical protein FZC76_13720 [Sutcliffiella horikoshii]